MSGASEEAGWAWRGERVQTEPVADDASDSACSMGWEWLPRVPGPALESRTDVPAVQ